MRLPSTIRFTDEKVKEAYYSLEKGDSPERELFKSISNALLLRWFGSLARVT